MRPCGLVIDVYDTYYCATDGAAQRRHRLGARGQGSTQTYTRRVMLSKRNSGHWTGQLVGLFCLARVVFLLLFPLLPYIYHPRLYRITDFRYYHDVFLTTVREARA
ncbi:hypothetical protein BD310DRAFT_925203 [Dichomitus squalens]|uniref:Uncharacterized protein n=1 Tax=Dichomitus squalens TaxID=114155 RepID=A0A4Q9PXG0_9APHY|nr:hypothetical protein BD310DRAFT_925203 [Dichomitus squalens]